MIERTLRFPGPASPGHTLAPQRRGPGDPCFQIDEHGAIWRTSLQRSGPVTARIHRLAPDTIGCQAWGQGAEEFAENLPALLGADDDAAGFAPEHPVVAAAKAKAPHLRIGRTGRVLEALIPAVLEQRVQGVASFRSWRLLVTRFGTPAPGPAPATMRVPPPAEVWRRHPVLGVPPRQRRPRPGPHPRGLRRAGGVPGTAERPTARAGPRGAHLAARGGGVDRRRNRPARPRRRRRAVGRRLPPGRDDRLDAAGSSASTTRRWSNCSNRCARTATGWCGFWRSAAGPPAAPRPPAGGPGHQPTVSRLRASAAGAQPSSAASRTGRSANSSVRPNSNGYRAPARAAPTSGASQNAHS